MSIVQSMWRGVLFVLWTIATIVFALPAMLLEMAMPNRSDHHDAEHGQQVPHGPLMVGLDAVSALCTYFIADLIRCWINGRTWPEVVAGQGSTLHLHIKMAIAVTIAWPLILYWLGWYKPRWRSWQWRLRGTAAAGVLLGLVMSATSLVLHRDLYPRSQIGFTVIMIPLMTAIVLSIRVWLLRTLRQSDPAVAFREE